MRRTIGLLTCAAALATTSPSVALELPADDWTPIATTWHAATESLVVNDAYATSDASWTVGTAVNKNGFERPWAMSCESTQVNPSPTCRAERLPEPTGLDAGALTIAGSSVDDLWVGGYDDNGPVVWHRDATTWTRTALPTSTTSIQQIAVAGTDETWALGTGTARTTPVLHRVGSTWNQVSPGSKQVFPGDCATPVDRQWFDLAILDGEPVLSGLCGAQPRMVMRTTTGWVRIDQTLPAGFFRNLAVAGDQLLAVSTVRTDKPPLFATYADGSWTSRPSGGFGPNALVVDVAGGSSGRALAVGLALSPDNLYVAATWKSSGTSWTKLTTPDAHPGSTYLSAVSIGSGGHSVAVGGDQQLASPSSAVILDRHSTE